MSSLVLSIADVANVGAERAGQVAGICAAGHRTACPLQVDKDLNGASAFLPAVTLQG